MTFVHPKQLEDAAYLNEQKLKVLKKKKKNHELLTASECEFLLVLDWVNYLKISQEEVIALHKWYELKESLLLDEKEALQKLQDFWAEYEKVFVFYSEEVYVEWETELRMYDELLTSMRIITSFKKVSGSPEDVRARKVLDDYEHRRHLAQVLQLNKSEKG